MLAEQIGVNAALAALQNFWDPAPVNTGVQLPQGAHSPEQAAAALQSLQQQQQYLAQAAPHTWSPIRASERLDPNVWSHGAAEPGAQHAAPSGARGGPADGAWGTAAGRAGGAAGPARCRATGRIWHLCARERGGAPTLTLPCSRLLCFFAALGFVGESFWARRPASAAWRTRAHSSR